MVYKGQRLALISDLKTPDENYVSAYIKEKRATHDKLIAE